MFKTIWPDWYTSRAIHIHVRVRTYDSSGLLVTNYTTQIFFPDGQNDAVLAAAAPYNSRSPTADPTTDENDIVLSSGETGTNIVTATGSISAGFKATFTITLDSASHGVPLTTKVTAKLQSVKVIQATHGARAVVAQLKTDGAVTVKAQLERGQKTLGSAHGHLPAGTHHLKVNVKSGARAGAATLALRIADSAKHTNTIRRHVHVPARHVWPAGSPLTVATLRGMASTWVLHTETKGTGATMVPLESVTKRSSVVVPPVAPRKPRPRQMQKPGPRPPRRFKVVDVMSRQLLLDDAGTRAVIDALSRVRSVVDVDVYVWHEERGRWRMLTFGERQAMWELADR